MPLYWFLLVITSLACDSVPGREVPIPQSILASGCLLSGWALLTRLASRSATRQVLTDEVALEPAAVALGQQMEVLRWLGLAMSMLALVGFGLAGLVNQIPWVGDSIAARALLLMLPAVGATVWSWACELHFDAAAQTATAQTATGGGGCGASPRSRRSSALRQLLEMFRLQGAWLVLPVLVLLTVIDAAEWLFAVEPERGAMLTAGIAIAALPLLLPLIVARIWSLRPIADPATARWLESLFAASGVRGLQLRQWDTKGAFCTALVAGFVPYFRHLLLSDALLWRLNREQTAMVVLHELAHLRRWHLPLRLLVLLPVWVVAAAVSHSLGDFPWASLTGIAAGVAASLVALRGVAYRTELDADAAACHMAVRLRGRVEGVPGSLAAAAKTLGDALEAVTADSPQARQATWLHPSIERRRAALRSLEQND
ncbi:M48 family metalloprotease [Candidatus Laterigemmans baculatus]|uniref:M48 family metalloprotease n=1 Tax=Candidatus Laterigemmans baculatus TaxID=2770505 RepID=UPI0013DB0573|nr:M48 family metalloprotease [Candidatus Laterigemmans baculatus]